VNADDVDHVVLARSMSMPSFSVPAPALTLSLSLIFPQKGKPLVAVETLWTGDRV